MSRRAGRLASVGAPRGGGALTATALAGDDRLAGLRRGACALGAAGRAAAGCCAAWTGAKASAAIDGLHREDDELGGEPEMPMPLPGSRTLLGPLSVMVVLDVSGSTSSSDPNRASFQALRLAADWLAQHSDNGRDRIGLVRFAERADAVAPVNVMRASTVIDDALARSTDKLGGGTTLGPAVDELCRHLSRRHGRTIALLITDGQVAEPADELRGLVGRVRAAADAVYLLALDHDRAWSRSTHLRYESLGLNGLLVIDTLSASHIASTIANVLVHEAGLATTSTSTPTSSPSQPSRTGS